eukprot:108190-Chlamydomonas_euryale.AAC.4
MRHATRHVRPHSWTVGCTQSTPPHAYANTPMVTHRHGAAVCEVRAHQGGLAARHRLVGHRPGELPERHAVAISARPGAAAAHGVPQRIRQRCMPDAALSVEHEEPGAAATEALPAAAAAAAAADAREASGVRRLRSRWEQLQRRCARAKRQCADWQGRDGRGGGKQRPCRLRRERVKHAQHAARPPARA